MKGNILFFDIETAPLPDASEFIEVSAPSNYKNQEKIDEYIKERTQKELEKAALDPDLGLITAVGMGYGDDAQRKILINSGRSASGETALLGEFWEMFRVMGGRVCGYNILGFDLPYLMKRSFVNGVEVPVKMIDMRRYSVDPVFDLYAIMYNWGQGRGMKWVAKRYGFLPEGYDGQEGSEAPSMSDAELETYLNIELDLLYSLFDRMNGVYFVE